MQILRSGPVESDDQLMALTRKQLRPGCMVVVAEKETVSFWAVVVLNGREVLYVGTEEMFNFWVAEEEGVQ